MDAQSEKEKYEETWENVDWYRMRSPGECVVLDYIIRCDPEHGKIIDFGAGTGRAAHRLHKLHFDVTMIDIAANCLDEDVKKDIGDQLIVKNLWEPLDMPRAPEGFCSDVMEHFPTEHVDAVIKNMMGLCDRVFFQICLEPHYDDSTGIEYHLTVRPFTWWRDKLNEFGTVIDARDLKRNGWFYVKS